MNSDKKPRFRRDLELFPVQQGNERFVLVRDHLGLIEEGKALPLQLYQVMALLDGTRTVRDVQFALMKHSGGVLVEMDDVARLIAHLDESYLLDTERYLRAKEKIVTEFAAGRVRPCSHCGRSYPGEPTELKNRLDAVLDGRSLAPKPETGVTALIAPHIDLSVGSKVYGSAYQWLKHTSPSRVVVLGVGHHMTWDLFCLTEKDFQTPLGTVRNDREAVQELMKAGRSIISDNDFVHKAEHSVEFQLIFLQHLLEEDSFTLIPILCGPLEPSLSEYTREAFLEKADPFLRALSGLLSDQVGETLILVGIDLSHIGQKFGHGVPARQLQSQSEIHDQHLIQAASKMDADGLWKESIRVKDQFHVCGFSAIACLLEVLPSSNGQVLDYQLWHEDATQSAVSFAALVFTSTQSNLS
ncbi:MAG: AmmeMemoRadiSam system protein B [Thermodesulfobacteriota bacterium]|nr:AmmeMemoRadiSam system protein B [Thermodesulfobacteriota bacterium]